VQAFPLLLFPFPFAIDILMVFLFRLNIIYLGVFYFKDSLIPEKKEEKKNH
jgi:hypothetical protein